jgi:hypothetical protein
MYEQVAHDMGLRTTQIGGRSYSLVLMPAYPAMELAKEMVILVAPTMSSIFDKIRNKEMVLPEEDMSFTEIAFVFVKQLSGVNIEHFANRLLFEVNCDGKRIDPSNHFRGKLKDLMVLLEFAIKENGILDFFPDLLREKGFEIPTLSQMVVMAKTKKEEPTTTTLDVPSN